LSLIGGQQAAAGNNLSMLYGGDNQTFNQSTAIAGLDQGVSPMQAMQQPTLLPTNNWANAVSAAANTAGSAIASGSFGTDSDRDSSG
jgi:hypothetical protein